MAKDKQRSPKYHVMCKGKRRYATLIAAGWAADAMFQQKGEWLRPYPCPWCKGFHVGH